MTAQTAVPIEDADALAAPSPSRATVTETLRPLAVPSRELWHCFTTYRKGGNTPARAAERVVEQMGVQGAQAERLTRELLDFSRFCALDESTDQYEARVREEDQAAVPRDPAVVEAEARAEQLAAVQSEAEQHVADLRAQIEKLAPEALTDADVKQELLNLHAELREAELAVELAPMAARETARREAEAREKAAAEQRAAAAAREQKITVRLAKAEAEADAALAAAADALAKCKTLAQERSGARAQAGGGPGEVRRAGWQETRAQSAIRLHFHRARVGELLPEIGRYSQRDTPLRETKGER